MTQYIPSPTGWVREHVELYEGSDGREGAERGGRATIIVTHRGRKTGAIRKTPLMRVADGDNYILVGSIGGAPKNPVWVYNLRVDPDVEIRDRQKVQRMRVREVEAEEKARLWRIAVDAFPPYEEYQQRTEREIPVFLAEPAV